MKSGPEMQIETPSQISAWFERKFEFNFPVAQYLTLCVRLSGTPPRLEEMVRHVSREVLVRKVPDKWSAQEHAGHLLDLKSLWMSRVDDFLNDQAALTVADLTNRRTNEANHNVRQLSKIPNRDPLSRHRRPTHSLRFSAAKISCDCISSK